MSLRSVVVVGASLAGLRAVETLRREGFDGRVVLVGAEAHEPYDRPPLSKQLLAGELEPAGVALRRTGYDDLDLDLELGVRAVGLDLDARQVAIDRDDGRGVQALGFDGLVIATGAAPRMLMGMDAAAMPDGVFVLRTLDDALALRARLDGGPKVVVVGAGFIGSEVAATCRSRGLEVTVLEALSAPLVRGLGPVLGAVCGELHRDHGVDLRLGVGVAGFEGAGRVERVRLDDGSAVDADVVVVGVGVAPVTDWLDGSGLTMENGVVCDATLLAAPGVVAAGDVARWPNPLFDGELARLEHWTNASEQGVAAARRLLHGEGAAPAEFAPVPFVWSDQYDRKIQTAGQFRGDDTMEVVHGSLDDRRFVALFGREGRLVGTLGISMPAKLMQYRRMIAERATFADALAHAARPRELRDVAMTSLLVTNDFPPKHGGIQSVLHELWRRLPATETTVFTTRFPGDLDWDADQPFSIVRSRHSQFLPTRSLAADIDALARDVRADVIFLDPWLPLGALAPRLRAAPYAVVVHGAEVTVPGRLPGSRALGARVLHGAAATVAIGEYPAREAVRAARRALPGVVIPPGVDADRFRPLEARRTARTRAPGSGSIPTRPSWWVSAVWCRGRASTCSLMRWSSCRACTSRSGERVAIDAGWSSTRRGADWSTGCTSSGASRSRISPRSSGAATCSPCRVATVGAGWKPKGSGSCSSRLPRPACRWWPDAVAARTKRWPTASRGWSSTAIGSRPCVTRSRASLPTTTLGTPWGPPRARARRRTSSRTTPSSSACCRSRVASSTTSRLLS